MADLSKLKRRNALGAPPPLEEASQNLTAPEVAPVSVAKADDGAAVPRPQRAGASKNPLPNKERQVRLDGRTLRKTGRTLQLATRVSEQFDERLRLVAQRDGLLLVEVLERALAAYEAQKS
jgi:hypothetical protein